MDLNDQGLDPQPPALAALGGAPVPFAGLGGAAMPPAAPAPPPAAPAAPKIDPLERLVGLQGEQADILGRKAHESAPAIAAAAKANAQPAPQQGKLGKVESYEAQHFQADATGWVQAAAILGAIAGAFSRRHATTALNAFGAAMKGFHDGNLEAAKIKMDEWKANSDAVIQNNNTITSEYKAAMQSQKTNLDQKMNEIALIAAKYQDELTYNAAMQKNWTLVAQLMDKRDYQNERLRQNQERIDKQYGSGLDDYQKQVEEAGRLIASGQKPPFVGFSATRGFGKDAMDAAYKINPEYSVSGYNAGAGAAKIEAAAEPKAVSATLTKLTQQRAAINQFENTAIKNGKVLIELADKIDKSGIPAIERWVRAGRQATGDPDVAKFHAQIALYRAEVAKIITNPNLGGVLSDSARNEAAGFLQSGGSAKQIRAVVELLEGDFGRRSQSIDEEIERVKSQLHPGAAPAASGGVPKVGETRTNANGVTGTWNGTGWEVK